MQSILNDVYATIRDFSKKDIQTLCMRHLWKTSQKLLSFEKGTKAAD